jgi:hypothetical protein
MALTLLETVMLIANVVFIIIAIFLFVRLRKMGKKVGTENKQQSELAGITDIAPEEFKPERFELKVQDIEHPEKTTATASDIFAESKIGVQEKTELKLEDEPLEVKEKPGKKESKRRKTAKKEPEEAVAPAIKEEVPSEKISVPEKTELKLEEILPGEEEKPEKKASKKKKKAGKREKVPAQEEPLIKTEPVQETIKEEKIEKKTARKKKKPLI